MVDGPAIDGLPGGSSVAYSIDEAGQQYADLRGPSITGGYQRVAVGVQQPEQLDSVLIVGKFQPEVARYETMLEQARNNPMSVDADELVRLARLVDPNNAAARRATPTEQLTSFRNTVATGVAGMVTGGVAFTGLRALGFGAINAGFKAGVIGDLTTQALNNGIYSATNGRYGRSGLNVKELAFAGGLGALPGAASAFGSTGREVSRIVGNSLAPYTSAGRTIGEIGSVTYKVPLYRAVPAGGDALDISFSVSANGRYTAQGQGGALFCLKRANGKFGVCQ